ncbi:uncharacterized protein [Haliotis asinina]|uniref:uncharacterized protein n=1 Tax=Haliotis asinina TaxID=109174 RepID=UPI00353213FA
MNSTSVCTNDENEFSEDLLRRSMSTPLPCLTDEEDEDEDKPSSPWVKAMGGTGDIGVVPFTESFKLSQEEDSEVPGDQWPEGDEETDSCMASPLLSSLRSVSYSDVDSTDTQLCPDQDASTPFHWAWVVADLVYERYGERMRRLRDNIEDHLTKFRSHTTFRSPLMCQQVRETDPV